MDTQNLTLHDLISGFINSRRYLSPRTVEFYQCCLAGLEWFAEDQHWPPPNQITHHHLTAFLDYVCTETHRWPRAYHCTYKKASPATIKHYATTVKTLFNWAEAEEYIEASPKIILKLPRSIQTEVEPYSDDDVRAMLAVCDYDAQHRYRYLGIRNKAIISLFVATGLRLSELANIKLSDLDPRLGQLRVMGKGAKMRVVPLQGEARKALKRYLTQAWQRGGDRLWKTIDGEPMTMPGVKIACRRLKRRAGVNSGGGTHRFRHYFATRYLEAGGDLNNLRLLLGHATLSMVLRYSRFVDIGRAVSAHGEFSPLDRLYNGGNHRHGNNGWGWKD